MIFGNDVTDKVDQNNENKSVFIIESAISQRPKVIGKYGRTNVVRFEAILQTLGDENNNGRVYDKGEMQKALDKINYIIKAGQLFGELDHPVEHINNPHRLFSVSAKNSSHFFREIYIEGNLVKGIGETFPHDNGIKLKNFILNEFAQIGFSLRADGVDKYINGRRSPANIKIVTWDAVSRPSHFKAVVLEYEALMEAEAILESTYSNKQEIVKYKDRLYSRAMFEKMLMYCTDKYFNKLRRR